MNMIGRTVGTYRIVAQVGLGGMATIYKAYDPSTDRTVALKLLPQQFSSDPQFQARFQREAKAIANLEHLHILPIFAYGEDDGIAYMAMRYMPSGTLSDRIAQGALPLAAAARLLTQLAGALDHAHARGVLHRDLKPSNVLLDEDGNAYLTDFGIAKIVEATLDLTGDRLLGTPAYMSPEQCRGDKELTPATDIYALGIVLYEMVTGKRPFHAETPVAVILQQLNDPLPPPHALRPDLPPLAENVILKALAKAPGNRYASAGEMAAAFAQALAFADTIPSKTRPQLPQSPPAETAVPPRPRRLPGWAWGALGGMLLLIIVGGVLLANRPRTAAPAAAATTCTPDQVQLFQADFESDSLNDWGLSDDEGRASGSGWRIVSDAGNRVLVGDGHYWAYAGHPEASDMVVHLRLRLTSPDSHFHLNLRTGADGRFYISPGGVNVDGPNRDDVSLASYQGINDTEWHSLTLTAVGDRVTVQRDGAKIADFTQADGPAFGVFALENTNGTVWYDDIVVCRWDG